MPKNNANSNLSQQIDELRKLLEENLRYTKTVHEAMPKNVSDQQKELQEILKQNLQYSKSLYAMVRKVNRWIIWRRVFGVIKILIILIPIILGIIYLPPLLKEMLAPYNEIFQQLRGVKGQLQ